MLPHGSLQLTMEHGIHTPRWHGRVAFPAYATPLVAMSQLGSMFQHANSVGAAFVLLTLGAGINFGAHRLGLAELRPQARAGLAGVSF